MQAPEAAGQASPTERASGEMNAANSSNPPGCETRNKRRSPQRGSLNQPNAFGCQRQHGQRPWVASLAVVLALATVVSVYGQQAQRRASKALSPISAGEFSRIIQQFSEEGGYFQSDNFTSNETAYLHIVTRLKEVGVSEGAYVGVGPEQNFTYIAKIRPSIAFIVDIRRQAMIQHLMYKAIFHHAETRAQFLAWLFSEPIPGRTALSTDVPIEDLIEYITMSPPLRRPSKRTWLRCAERSSGSSDFRYPRVISSRFDTCIRPFSRPTCAYHSDSGRAGSLRRGAAVFPASAT